MFEGLVCLIYLRKCSQRRSRARVSLEISWSIRMDVAGEG